MKKLSTIFFALLVVVLLAACNKNYYSGNGKGGKGCGCPATKGMSGY
ncbi:MAG: hypothetical protein HOP10_01855 [Chitinophagaceae bacterium]|nr:hypothetical protein [Chitinophagaceae bacterium]